MGFFSWSHSTSAALFELIPKDNYYLYYSNTQRFLLKSESYCTKYSTHAQKSVILSYSVVQIGQQKKDQQRKQYKPRQEDASILTEVLVPLALLLTHLWHLNVNPTIPPSSSQRPEPKPDGNHCCSDARSRAVGNRVLGQSSQSPVEEKHLLGQIHPGTNAFTSQEDFGVQTSSWKECEEGQGFDSGFAYQNILQQLCFCYLVLWYLFQNQPMENLWARFLPRCLGLKKVTKRNKVWKSPSSVHLLLAPAFISEESFRFEAKSLVGEDKSRQKARGTTSDLQVGCVARTIWKYCKEQTDPGGSVNSLPCEH